MDDKSCDTFREMLLDRRAEITELQKISLDSRQAVELDQTSVGRVSRIDAIQSQAMALSNERNRNAELIRIEAALKRLDDGDYGLCIVCDEDIAIKRLKFDPSIPTCITCASKK